MTTVQRDTAGQGGEHGLLFHSFDGTGIPHAYTMFDGRFPCQQAHKLGERLLRFCPCANIIRAAALAPFSQEARAFSVGMTRVAVSRIENGRTWPQAQTLDRIILELDIDCPTWQCEGSVPRRCDRSMARGKTLESLNYASDCVRNVGRSDRAFPNCRGNPRCRPRTSRIEHAEAG